MDTDCIFCKIVAGDMPADIRAENDDVLVLKDIAPKANTHYLIIPKKHYKNIEEAEECSVFCSLLRMARELAHNDPSLAQYRLIINNGYEAGQRVFHLHVHFLSGKGIPEF